MAARHLGGAGDQLCDRGLLGVDAQQLERVRELGGGQPRLAVLEGREDLGRRAAVAGAGLRGTTRLGRREQPATRGVRVAAWGCRLGCTGCCSRRKVAGLQPLPASERFELGKLYGTAAVDVGFSEHPLERGVGHEDAALAECRLELRERDAARAVRVEGDEGAPQLGAHLPRGEGACHACLACMGAPGSGPRHMGLQRGQDGLQAGSSMHWCTAWYTGLQAWVAGLVSRPGLQAWVAGTPRTCLRMLASPPAPAPRSMGAFWVAGCVSSFLAFCATRANSSNESLPAGRWG